MPTANAGGAKIPPFLRVVEGRGTRKDGLETDSGGRPVLPGPNFDRLPPEKPEELCLDDDASWLWDRVIDQMQTIGLLKPIDGAALEVMCHTFARWRQAVRMRHAKDMVHENSQGNVTAPWVGIEERASKDFRAWCAEFGITPAAERNLVGKDGHGAPGEENPF